MQPRFNPDSSLPADPPPPPTAGGEGETPQDGPPIMREVELKDFGPNLPCGFVVGDQRVRPFRIRPFRLKEEKVLAEMREKNKSKTLGRFVTQVLAHMVQTVGPHSFDSMKEPERMLLISQMPMCDVLYMYLYMRYDALGPDEPVMMTLSCPRCNTRFDFPADLGTLRVRVVPDQQLDLTRKYNMRDGIPYKGEIRKMIELHPLPWSALDNEDFAREPALREAATVISSIVGMEGVTHKPFILPEQDLDELTKYDYEGIVEDVEMYTPGPLTNVLAQCNSCMFEFVSMIQWVNFDGFFRRSSQRQRGRR